MWIDTTWYSPFILVAGLLAAAVVWPLGEVCKRFALARMLLLLATIGWGAAIAVGALNQPHGYLVGYDFAAVWLLAAVIAIGSTVLLIARRTRPHGLAGWAASILILGSFYAVYLSGVHLGLNTWGRENTVSVPAVAPR